MSNITNYQSNVNRLETTYDRYMVSRVVTNPLENLLETEVPAGLPQNYFVELSLYSYADNRLVFNTTIDPRTNSEIFRTTTIQYQGGSSRRLLYIDFSKTNAGLIDGRFELVLNFFAPEIGNVNAKPLVLTKISPSRTEVEVRLTPEYRTPESASIVTSFASPQINKDSILGAMRQFFNQPNSSTLGLQTDNTTLTYPIIREYFPPAVTQSISASKAINVTYESTLSTSIQTLLNRAYTYASESVRTSTAERFTDTMIYQIVSASIVRARPEVATTTEVVLL